MGRKRILWLVSWYPNKTDAFDGDFIQRHARAAARHHSIHVLFVKGIDDAKSTTTTVHEDLTEEIIYYKKKTGFLGRAENIFQWQAGYKKAIKKYCKKGLPDLVHVHIPWKVGLIALWIKHKYGIPFIISEHWNFYTISVSNSIYTKPLFYREALKNIYVNAQQVIAVSDFLRKEIMAFAKVKQLSLLPNIVDTALFFYDAHKNNQFTFIHVSNMAPVKNVETILESFYLLYKQISDVSIKLLLIGNRTDEFIHTVDSWGLLNKSIFFMGELPYDGVANEMRKAHCLVLNSDTESFSCVTAEAICCGLPIIANNTGALPELITEKNGMLIQPANKELLAKIMQQMITSWQEYNHFEIAEKAANAFGINAISKKFTELYRSQLERMT